jgi:hypothetical protein
MPEQKNTLPPQEQKLPGSEQEMDPKPVTDDENYKGKKLWPPNWTPTN